MVLNALNQNSSNLRFNMDLFMKTPVSMNLGNISHASSYYAQQNDPMYVKEMDSDGDGKVTFDDFKEYCRTNNLSPKEITNMLEKRTAHFMTQDIQSVFNKSERNFELPKAATGNLDLIYATDSDDKYDEKMDINSDKTISYKEYLRYCEQNAKTEQKPSDTKIVENDKRKFMTVSFGHAVNAYSKNETASPEGKVESNV